MSDHEPRARITWTNIVIIILATLTIGANILGLLEIQSLIKHNQAETVTARAQNMERQDDLKNYTKCIVLLRFNQPPIDLSSKAAVSKALDVCATTVPSNK